MELLQSTKAKVIIEKTYKEDDVVIGAGVCTGQKCSLTSGEYDSGAQEAL